MHVATRVTRAGHAAAAQGEPFAAGPVFASMFRLQGDPSSSPYVYGRYHNPTWTAWEAALAEFEGGPVVSFASGMAAVTAVLGTVLRPGDVVIIPTDGYYTVRNVVHGWFAEHGITVRTTPTAGTGALDLLDGARLLWLESPSNPGLDVCDIAKLSAAAHAHGAFVAVDNTTATIIGQQPLALGADFSVASDTKAMTGHNDLMLGHVATRDEDWSEALQTWRIRTGAVPGPMEVWLAHRSLATLELRLTRMCDNALSVARFLSARRGVTGVRHPGLENHPAYELARRQMQFNGPVVSFELADESTAERFLAACQLVLQATSFGSLHTTAERRARWGGDAVPAGFIRLSAGCEHIDDLIDDLEQALDAATR